MTETMAAYRIVRWGEPPIVTEAPVPDPGPGQVRVRVAGNGLCHSDIGMAAMPGSIGESLGWRLPFTLGHEVGGWVDALGPGCGDGHSMVLRPQPAVDEIGDDVGSIVRVVQRLLLHRSWAPAYGVKLATDVYRPATPGGGFAPGRFPTILGRTSYDKSNPVICVSQNGKR